MKNLTPTARTLLAGCLDAQQKMVEELLLEMDRLLVAVMESTHPDVDDWSRGRCVRAYRTKDHAFIARNEWDPSVLALRDVIHLYECASSFLRSDWNTLHSLQEMSKEPKAWHEH